LPELGELVERFSSFSLVKQGGGTCFVSEVISTKKPGRRNIVHLKRHRLNSRVILGGLKKI